MKKYRIVMSVLLIAWMLLIFMLSAQSGEKSAVTSKGFADTLLSFIYPKFKEMSTTEQQALLQSIMLPIRKLAHFTAYFVLGVISASLFVTLRNYDIYFKSVFSWVFCLLYAISDEIHQYFVPQRACRLLDIFIDSSGAALAIVIVTLLICRIKLLQRFKKIL